MLKDANWQSPESPGLNTLVMCRRNDCLTSIVTRVVWPALRCRGFGLPVVEAMACRLSGNHSSFGALARLQVMLQSCWIHMKNACPSPRPSFFDQAFGESLSALAWSRIGIYSCAVKFRRLCGSLLDSGRSCR